MTSRVLKQLEIINKKTISVVLVCILMSVNLFAQLEGANWYFGRYAGLDFSSGAPVPIFDGSLNTSEGCSSVSDRNGNLLFYTEGSTVYDRNHNIMLNGTGLFGHSSSAMSAVICPKPGSWNASIGRFDGYIICTIDYNSGSNGISWSEVDMNGNGGLGEVVAATKNTHLFGTTTVEAANFAVHSNGCDYWLIAKEVGTAEWKVYPVTSAGVGSTYVSSFAGPNTPAAWGNIKTSPDSDVIGATSSANGLNIFDFDRTTGQITHRYTENTHGGSYYSLEFSTNGRFVYYTRLSDPTIYQVDLQSPDQASFESSVIPIGTTANTAHHYRLGALQMGPNGKIYLALPSSGHLGVIEAPNLLGVAANYVDMAIDITGVNVNGQNTGVNLGLPSFPSFLFKEPKQISYTQLCYSQDLMLQLSDYNDLYGQEWYVSQILNSFPTTPTSTDQVVNLLDLDPGQYNIKVILDYDCYSDSIERVITISEFDGLDLGEDLCYEPGIVLEAVGDFDTYEWQDGSTNSTFQVTAPGVYSCKVGKVGSNLVFNGDFEQGNYGFTSQYVYDPIMVGQGFYTVGTTISNAWWHGCVDHTSGTGNMMILDADCLGGGSGNSGTNFWCQTLSVIPNTDYYFSVYLANANNDANTAEIGLNINSNLIASHALTPGACSFEEFSFVWNSGANTSIELCLNELTGVCSGVDFVVDDIGFSPICYTTDTIEVFDLPTASFQFDNECAEEAATLTSTSTSPNGNISGYFWDIQNDGVIDYTTMEVDHTYNQAGFYTIQHVVEDERGCRDTTTNDITVYALPVADFMVDFVCEDSNSNFVNTSTISPVANDVIVGFEWDFGNNTTSTLENNSITYGDENVYNVEFIVTTNYGCKDTVYKDAIVYPIPEVDFSFTDVCIDLATDFVDLSTVSNDHTTNTIDDWSWDFADGQVSNIQNPSHTYNLAGSYDVTLTVVSNHGCVAVDEKEVTVFPKSEVSFVGNNLEGCSPVCPSISSTSTIDGNHTLNYEWFFNGTPSYGNSPYISDCFENDGLNTMSYDVRLKVTTDKGCESEHTEFNYISVFADPIADFYHTPESPTVLSPGVKLNNTSLNATSYLWNFLDVPSSNEVHPEIVFPEIAGSYWVELIATSENNCRDTIIRHIEVMEELIFYIPNSFTPDHNQYNDVFKPVFTFGFEPDSYVMQVYNRWGELLFETRDVEVGWDGTYGVEHNGVVQEGTYIWRVSFLEMMSDKRHNYTGYVNLIK